MKPIFPAVAAPPWMEGLALYACRLDGRGCLLACNQRLAQVLAAGKDELTGRAFCELVAKPDEQPAFRALFGAAHPRSLPGEFLEGTLAPSDDGPTRHVRWFIGPFDSDSGEPGYLALGWDDTSQVQMERFLLRLARVVDLTQEPVVIANERGVAEYINPAFTAASGYFPGDIIGRSLSGIVAVPEDAWLIHDALGAFHRGDTWESTLRLRRKDGAAMTVNARISPVRDASKRTTHYIAIARDLSRQHNLERQVEELQRLEALGTLANGLAHRFNNILAAIAGQTELMLMSCHDDNVRTRAKRIFEAAMKGKEVVEQLTIFGRKNEQRARQADLVPVVRNAVNFIRAAQPRGLSVVDELPPESPPVLANTGEIHQALLNLLTNAIDALTDRRGTITVRMRMTTAAGAGGKPLPLVAIEVEDDGPGVPLEIQHRIFEPFFTTRSLANASGMGLAITHGIVTRHGGTIECVSEPGQGARFTIMLPVATEASAEALVKSGTGRILLVDAAGYALDTGKRQLEELDYEVIALANFDVALEALRDPSVDVALLLTCHRLSQRSGLDFVREARRLRPDLPVVLCANLADEVDRQQARHAGVDEVLRKPVPVDQLSHVLHELISQ